MTLEECIEMLDNPERYLRRMLQNMTLCKRMHGAAFVRLGLTGEGKAPNYLVTSNESGPDGFPDGFAKYVCAFSGRNHQSLMLEDYQLISSHWNADPADAKRVAELFRSAAQRGEAQHLKGEKRPSDVIGAAIAVGKSAPARWKT